MRLYLSVIGISMAIIAALNMAFATASPLYVIIAVILCAALQFALDGLIAIVINKMPDTRFYPEHPLYRVSKTEQTLYKKLRVRRWKDQVWELGGLGGFSKKVLREPNNPAYIEKFIIECHKGVLTHRLSYPVGFLVMLLFPNICALTIALPVAVVNLFLNILPTLVLRYNTPMLLAMWHRMQRR